MPFLFKYTLIFEGQGHGFSESLYFERATSDLDAAWQFVQDYPAKRRPLLGAQFYIKGQRLAYVRSDTGEPIKRVTRIQKEFQLGTQSQPAEETNMSLQVLMQNSTSTRKKLLFLGGPWRSIFPFGDSYDPTAGSWTSFFNAWKESLIAHGFGWLHSVIAEQRQILNYVFDPDSGITTYTIQAPGITWPATPGPVRVSIEFPLSRSPLDGVQLVIPVTATSCYTATPRPAAPFSVAGVIRLYGSEFVNLATLNTFGNPGTVIGQNPVSRKRGRPLLVSRGRQPVRRRW